MSRNSHLTEAGLPGVGVVPFGIHLCHFYPSREELLSGLIPYFSAGVSNNELCIWIAAEPLTARDIAGALSQHSQLQAALINGQLRVMDAIDWYGDPSTLDPEQVIQQWFTEEQNALAKGYEGLRITGNTSFVPRESWSGLMAYERLLHSRLRDRRIVTCCSYSRLKCDAVDVLEVVQCHHAALEAVGSRWHVFTRPT